MLAVDVKQCAKGKWEVVTHGGRRPTGLDAIHWLREAARRGVGEILLTSMDADGTLQGYDLPLLRAAAAAVTLPIIASGGGGGPADLTAAVREGNADAVLAASIFHDRRCSISEVKQHMTRAGLEIRHAQ